MTITLPRELELAVNDRLKSGTYKNTEELISAALRLLEAREKGMDTLRSEIMRGVDDIDQGRFTSYASDAELSELALAIIRDAEKDRGGVPASR